MNDAAPIPGGFDAALKAAKCVTCGVDVLIGKFASAKTAYCEAHKGDKPAAQPKPTRPAMAPLTGLDMALAGALESPAPAVETQPPGATAPSPPPVVPPKAVIKASPELREAFSGIVGRVLGKDPLVIGPAGFKVSRHGIIYYEFSNGKIVTFVELNGKCIGLAVTSAGRTEGFFDMSTVHQLKPDESDVLAAFLATGQ